MLASKQGSRRKTHIIRASGLARRGNILPKNCIGLQVTCPLRLSLSELSAMGRSLKKSIKTKHTLRIQTFATSPQTRRSKGARMGAGKGSIAAMFALARPAAILCVAKISDSGASGLIRACLNTLPKLPAGVKIAHNF